MNAPPKIDNAPGLVWRPHKTGWVARWQCRSDLARRGFRVKAQRIWFGYEPSDDDIAWIQSRCNILQDEMLVWGRGGIPKLGKFDGSINSLIDCYQVDGDSPFRKLRYRTRIYYTALCGRVAAEFGERQISEIKAREVLHWYDRIAENGTLPMAHSVVGMLRTLINYGASLQEDDACELLSSRLRKMRFKMGRPRVESLTYEQANIIRRLAHEADRPSIALAQAFQFECTFRQKDVIGEWVPISEPGMSDTTWGNSKWLRGIRWEEIDATLTLRHVTSKRQKEVTVDLRQAPMVLQELGILFPAWASDRSNLPASGPVIISERHGVPWPADEFRRQWRLLAGRGGIPKTVRNMDTRSGAITEALMAGAELDMVRKTATHSDVQMTQRYSRGDAEAAAEVMRRRVSSRNKTGTEGT